MPADFASKETKELDGVEFYEQLKKVRDGYAYPLAVHHQKNDGKASKLQTYAWTLEKIQSLESYLVVFYDSLLTLSRFCSQYLLSFSLMG